MASQRRSLSFPSWPLFCCCCFFLAVLSTAAVAGNSGASASDRKAYIVYMGALPTGVSTTDAEAAHRKMLDRVGGSGASSTNILHSYKRSFNGFSAMLSEEEAKAIRGMDGVVSVFPSKYRKLHTTRSWDFMNFPVDAARAPSVESNVIVGMIDSGLWPESKSFDDTGYGRPPSKWKGTCQTGPDFKCNNKVIGGQFYHTGRDMEEGDIPSPVDSTGHGTHTASTVAGRQVTGVDLYGLAPGTARGGVPSARIAVYKVCWSDGCFDVDILAAMDDAIADGVDIISVSFGGDKAMVYLHDVMSIAAFHAMKKGILTSVSAGNSGPTAGSVVNIAPWMLTVAASTIDRRFVADAELGNGKKYEGVAINTFDLKGKMYPLIYGGDSPDYSAGSDPYSAKNWNMNSLDKTLVEGKIVLCDSPTGCDEILSPVGVGVIMQYPETDYAVSYTLPAVVLDLNEGAGVFSYINETRNPTATISRSKQITDPKAPYVASFSARGPNVITDILKPDLTAPGIDILAAWSSLGTMSGSEGDKRKPPYNIISGTSMSCPHVSGSAAYTKSFHPTWSPAAIKSALMTTALPMRPSSNSDTEFAYGAGHINPLKALHPGLIYDADEQDYVRMLCGSGYDSGLLRLITGDDSVCSPSTTGAVWDLNYPSFALPIRQEPISESFHRTVTNVGSPNSTYKATVNAPPELRVDVNPSVLSFKQLQERQSFVVSIRAVKDLPKDTVSASLTWSDGVYQVRSPIVVYVPLPHNS